MVTEKTTMNISLEGKDIKSFKSIISQLDNKTIGFKGIHNHLNKDEVELLKKLNDNLNKKDNEEN